MRWSNGATSFRLSSRGFTLSDSRLTGAIQQLSLSLLQISAFVRFCNGCTVFTWQLLVTIMILPMLRLLFLGCYEPEVARKISRDSGLPKWLCQQVERRKQGRTTMYLLLRAIQDSKQVTPGRIVIITSRNDIARNATNFHAISTASYNTLYPHGSRKVTSAFQPPAFPKRAYPLPAGPCNCAHENKRMIRQP